MSSRISPGYQAAKVSVYPAVPEFDHFSFWDDERGFITPSADQLEALARYLDSEFGVSDFMMSGPYLVLYCNRIPDAHTIAGCIAVWLEEGSPLPAEIKLGDLADGPDVELDSTIAGELRPYRLPTPSTVATVARSFPSTQYVTYYNTGIIIELPRQSEEEYQESLQELPGHFSNGVVTLGYHNGPLTAMGVKWPVIPVGDKEMLTSEIVRLNDETVIDGDVIGRQRVKCLGIRVRIDKEKKERDLVTSEASGQGLQPDGKYISLVQGIFAASVLNPDPGRPGAVSPVSLVFSDWQK